MASGWQFAGCALETIVWSDGETTDSTVTATYQRAGYYPVSVARRSLAPNDYADVVNDDGSAFALTVVDLAGVSVTYPGGDRTEHAIDEAA